VVVVDVVCGNGGLLTVELVVVVIEVGGFATLACSVATCCRALCAAASAFWARASPSASSASAFARIRAKSARRLSPS
jgi:hypothetical protein